MTFLPDLAFAHSSLSLRYRASEAPQRLRIAIDGAWPPRGFITDWGRVKLDTLVDGANLGLCGGDQFDPRVGRAQVLSGPARDRPLPATCDYHWEVEVAGVGTLAMRTWVELLAEGLSTDTPPTSMLIEGSLPLDGSPLSITERHVAGWLDNSDDYSPRWPSLPFEVLGKQGKRDAVIKAVLRGAASQEHAQEFQSRLLRLKNYATRMPSRAHEPFSEYGDTRYGRSKTELTATITRYDVAMEPIRALVLNMLHRFHYEVAELERVELTFP